MLGIASLIGATKASKKLTKPVSETHYSASSPIEPAGGCISEDH